MKEIRDLRILHFLSPKEWDNKRFDWEMDDNWHITEKIIRMLPNCAHYIVVPEEHNLIITGDNIYKVSYPYHKSVQICRGMFDYDWLRFNFISRDIDFAFLHQPEIAYNIHQWLHKDRCYEDVKYFGFFHWIDCDKSRGSVKGCPPFYFR